MDKETKITALILFVFFALSTITSIYRYITVNNNMLELFMTIVYGSFCMTFAKMLTKK